MTNARKLSFTLLLLFGLFSLPLAAAEFQVWKEARLHPQTVIRLEFNGEGEQAQWRQLPKELLQFTKLEGLKLDCMEKLEGLPAEIGQMKALRVIDADNGNGCASNLTIPDSIAQLPNLKMLILYGALDGSSPEHPHGRGKSLPEAVYRLKQLEVLNLARNGIQAVSESISALVGLRRLNLEYNQLKALPVGLGNLKNLQELRLRGNRIHELPAGLAALPGLTIDLGNNSLTLDQQKKLRAQFPKAVFSFENEFDDASANQEPR